MSKTTKYGYTALNLGDRNLTFICWNIPELAETTGIKPDTLRYQFHRQKSLQYCVNNWLIMRCRFVMAENNRKGNPENLIHHAGKTM